MIDKIEKYCLEREAKEFLADNPYVSDISYAIECIRKNSQAVEEKSNSEKKLFVVVDWKGISNPWSPYVLDPLSSYNPENVYEKAVVFSALCAIRDPKGGCGDPNTLKKRGSTTKTLVNPF